MSADAPSPVEQIVQELEFASVGRLDTLIGILGFGERYSVLEAPERVTIAADAPTAWEHGGAFASVAIVNPNPFPVYVGTGSSDGVSGREFVRVARRGWMVLPLRGRRLSLGAGASAGDVYVLPLKVAQPFAAGELPAGSSNAATTSKEALTGAEQTLLAANVERVGATIYCDAATTLYVKLGSAATADDWTVKLGPDDYYELPAGYAGEVTAISAAATGQARVTELV